MGDEKGMESGKQLFWRQVPEELSLADAVSAHTGETLEYRLRRWFKDPENVGKSLPKLLSVGGEYVWEDEYKAKGTQDLETFDKKHSFDMIASTKFKPVNASDDLSGTASAGALQDYFGSWGRFYFSPTESQKRHMPYRTFQGPTDTTIRMSGLDGHSTYVEISAINASQLMFNPYTYDLRDFLTVMGTIQLYSGELTSTQKLVETILSRWTSRKDVDVFWCFITDRESAIHPLSDKKDKQFQASLMVIMRHNGDISAKGETWLGLYDKLSNGKLGNVRKGLVRELDNIAEALSNSDVASIVEADFLGDIRPTSDEMNEYGIQVNARPPVKLTGLPTWIWSTPKPHESPHAIRVADSQSMRLPWLLNKTQLTALSKRFGPKRAVEAFGGDYQELLG